MGPWAALILPWSKISSVGCLTMTKLGKLEATPAITSTMPEVWRMEAMRSTAPAALRDAPSATTMRTVGDAS